MSAPYGAGEQSTMYDRFMPIGWGAVWIPNLGETIPVCAQALKQKAEPPRCLALRTRLAYNERDILISNYF